MHKAVILLVKADNRPLAIEKARKFMDEHKDCESCGHGVWDWYVIGGRWTQTLAPQHKAFEEKVKSILVEKGGFVSQNEVNEKQPKLQEVWKEMGGTGLNPYTDNYRLDKDGQDNDVMPLAKCMEIVGKWKQTEKDGQKKELEAQKWLEKKDKKGNSLPDWRMYGYCLKCAAEIYQQEFGFETNVFNTEKYNFSIPDNLEEWSAVLIDMHS